MAQTDLPLQNASSDEAIIESDRGYLSNEIWLNIIAHSTSTAALYNLCLTSRTLNTLAQPFLHQSCEQPPYPNGQRSLRLLVRTLYSRPDLAARVRRLKIYDWDEALIYQTDSAKWQEWKQGLDVEINHLKVPFFQYSERPEGTLELWEEMALLLSLTTDLEHLALELPIYSSQLPGAIRQAQHASSRDLLFLNKLATLEIDYADTEDGFELSAIEPFLKLPSMTNLLAHKCNNGDFTDIELPLDGSNLNIQHMDFMCSVLRDEVVEQIVLACHTLKSFQLVLGPSTVGSLHSMDFDRVCRAFRKHEKSLERLIIDVQQCLCADGLEGGVIPVNSLKSWTRLRHLDLPQCALLGEESELLFNVLPNAVETLVIRECKPSILPQLTVLGSFSAKYFPHLEGIAITGDELGDVDLVGLQETSQELGVEFNHPRLLKRADHSPWKESFSGKYEGYESDESTC